MASTRKYQALLIRKRKKKWRDFRNCDNKSKTWDLFGFMSNKHWPMNDPKTQPFLVTGWKKEC